MTVLGLGHDVVDVESFRRQCLSPGSLFVARASAMQGAGAGERR